MNRMNRMNRNKRNNPNMSTPTAPRNTRTMRLKSHQEAFIRAAHAYTNGSSVINRTQVLALCEAEGLDHPHWLTSNTKYRHATKRAHYVLPLERVSGLKTEKVAAKAPTAPAPATDSTPQAAVAAVAWPDDHDEMNPSLAFNGGKSLVPDRLDIYVPWGHHDFIVKVLTSRAFYPIFISGLSGNGKTTSVEQACAELGREFFRVNINEETDEDDLLGGFRLVNGNTVFQYGPVVEAMRRGAVLLLDEIDLGKGKILCLQSVLEGKGVYLKKINQWIHPADGFQVFLTGNTKGQGTGEHDDRFVGTNVMNEAFLDRIPVMIDQGYPPITVEKRILGKVATKHCGAVSDDAKAFIDNLTKWAEIVRRTFDEGAIDDIITTRRLVQIIQGYCLVGDRLTCIRNCVARFEKSVQDSFLSLYEKIDGETNVGAPSDTAPSPSALTEKDILDSCGAGNVVGAVAGASAGRLVGVKVTVPFHLRGEVKSRGADWNSTERTWYFAKGRWENLDDAAKSACAPFKPTWVSMDTNTHNFTELCPATVPTPVAAA